MLLTYTAVYGVVILSTITVGYVGTKIADKYIRSKKLTESSYEQQV